MIENVILGESNVCEERKITFNEKSFLIFNTNIEKIIILYSFVVFKGVILVEKCSCNV